MAHSLVSWAQRLPDLTPTERNVFTAICDVVDPMQGGYFYKRLSHFILEDAPFIRTESRLRAHIARIQAKGYMKTERRGGGPKSAKHPPLEDSLPHPLSRSYRAATRRAIPPPSPYVNHQHGRHDQSAKPHEQV